MQTENETKVIVRSYPKIFYFWPTLIITLFNVFAITFDWAFPSFLHFFWLLTVALNLTVYYSSCSIFEVYLRFFLYGVILALGYFYETPLLNLELSLSFYYSIATLLICFFIVSFFSTRLDYWEFKHNEAKHHIHSIFFPKKVASYPLQNTKIALQLDDAFKYILTGSATLKIQLSPDGEEILLEDVLRARSAEAKLQRLWAVLKVSFGERSRGAAGIRSAMEELPPVGGGELSDEIVEGVPEAEPPKGGAVSAAPPSEDKFFAISASAAAEADETHLPDEGVPSAGKPAPKPRKSALPPPGPPAQPSPVTTPVPPTTTRSSMMRPAEEEAIPLEVLREKEKEVAKDEFGKEGIRLKEEKEVVAPLEDFKKTKLRKKKLAKAPSLAMDLKPDDLKSSASPYGDFLSMLIGICLLPFTLTKMLAKGVYEFAEDHASRFNYYSEQLLNILGDLLAGKHYRDPKKMPWFESLLSDDAGRPGAIERFLAHFRFLLKTMQHTVGTKILIWIHAVDVLIDFVTSYLQTFFRAWQMSRTMARAAKRKLTNSEIEGLLEDFSKGRNLLAQTLSFHFYQKVEEKPSFPLEKVIELRGHLSEMKRDLSMLTNRQISNLVKEEVSDRVKSMFPNPFELFTSLKDIFLLGLFLRYSREEMEKMYIEMVLSYQKMLVLKAESLNTAVTGISTLQLYEFYMQALAEPSLLELDNLEEAIEVTQDKIQRLIQAFCNPTQYLFPQRWSRFDLIREVSKINQGQKIHPLIELEFDYWLTQQTRKILKKKKHQLKGVEALQRRQEYQELKQKLKAVRKLSFKFLPIPE